MIRFPSVPHARLKLAATAAVAAVALSACGGGPPSSTSAGSDKLTIQFTGPPVSLNPALASTGGSVVFTALAYDPLIYQAGDGKLVPDLATSWQYVGTGNMVFEVTLRDGVKFSDGTPMDANAVVGSLKYFLSAKGPMISHLGKIASIDADGTNKVRITYSEANPDAALSLTQYNEFGLVISPKGVADPASLLKKSAGTGAYTFDSADAVTNSSYTYKKNPSYWQPSAQKFQTVNVKVIGDPNAVLSAITTGQVDFAGGAADTAASAKSQGISITPAPYFNWSLNLLDRDGSIAKPLADVRVRQAIALAFDRSSLATALGGDYGKPSTQDLLPGTDGYMTNDPGHGYDLNRAKQLMADAGYADGFSMPVITTSILDKNTTISQAITQALGAIGIKVDLHVESTGMSQYSSGVASKKYAASIYPTAGTDMMQFYQQDLAKGVPQNPENSSDPQLEDPYQKALAAPTDAERTNLYQQMSKRLQDLAWIVPIYQPQTLWYSKNVHNVAASAGNPNPLPAAPDPALAWTLGG
ncbi:ABC transporter substrate-binding protein [Sinomonas sp. ASV486]|uniref:ABC transporter substrate-binding protein n=1 Tax=Sinomonas sp. ASV486 TaxID=3051170 RepID=UPI0027DE8165|nr:ABC transporter substrate-binding protein [Sinomonas sp. ASV486]MDQ4488975.1 ABC transporter substrate-binding protein [Sinomonas sp. ASV486]